MISNEYWKICYQELSSKTKAELDTAHSEVAKARAERNHAWDLQHKQALKISELSQEMGELRNELNMCKKPEPKFKVEQIVVSNYSGYESSFWIHGKKFIPPTYSNAPDGWHYTQQRQDSPDRRWVPEKQLREQTDVEQGLISKDGFDGQ